MRSYILPGYIFGALYGLAHVFLRMEPKAGMSLFEWIALGVLVSLTVAGAIGAAAGFVVAFCVAARNQFRRHRSP